MSERDNRRSLRVLPSADTPHAPHRQRAPGPQADARRAGRPDDDEPTGPESRRIACRANAAADRSRAEQPATLGERVRAASPGDFDRWLFAIPVRASRRELDKAP